MCKRKTLTNIYVSYNISFITHVDNTRCWPVGRASVSGDHFVDVLHMVGDYTTANTILSVLSSPYSRVHVCTDVCSTTFRWNRWGFVHVSARDMTTRSGLAQISVSNKRGSSGQLHSALVHHGSRWPWRRFRRGWTDSITDTGMAVTFVHIYNVTKHST